MSLNQIINQENQNRLREVQQYTKKIEGPENVFSRPVVKPEPEIIQALREQEQKDRETRARVEQGFDTEVNTDTPASFYHEIHGETMLRSVMELPSDSMQTEFLNNYILEKMRIGKMQDTRANFDKVLNHLLARNNLSRNQQKPYLINKLYLYLKNGDVAEDDNIILSILSKRGARRHGIRR